MTVRHMTPRLGIPACGAVLGVGLVLLAAPPAWAAAGGSGNPWLDLLWKAVNFGALVVLIWFFARKPVAAMLRNAAEGRRTELQSRRDQAAAAEREMAEQRRKIENLEAELQRMRDAAQGEAEQEKARLIEEARQHAERLKTNVRLQVEQEFAKARGELKRQLADDTVRLAEQQIKGRMDDESRRRTVNGAIEQLGSR